MLRYSVPYFQTPNAIYDNDIPNLTVYDIAVYQYIVRCGNNSTAFPSYNTIAKKCRISRRKAIDTISHLIGLGLLEKETLTKKNGNQKNIYSIFTP
jgi:predicted transcriptional regulator